MMNNKRLVWPLSIRIIHWVLAVIIILNMFLLESGDPPHRYLGYVGVAIVLIRFFYGFKGSEHVAFSSFPMHPKKLFHFITNHFGKNKTDYEGHNPPASYVYFLMWFAVIALGVTGFLLGTDKFWGDEGMENLHTRISYFLEALIVIHFTGIIVDSILFKRKTWMGMIR